MYALHMKKIGEQKLTYSRSLVSGPIAGYNNAINVFDGLTRANHKHQEWTTRDGHLLGALCDITIRVPGGQAFTTNFYGLGNTWIVRNAFRKFHFLRNAMFEKAGVEKSEIGKYGHTLRPNLLPNDRWQGTLNADFDQTFPGADLSAEWDNDGLVQEFTILSNQTNVAGTPIRNYMQETLEYSKLVSSMQVIDVSGAAGDEQLYDEWDLHIILGHDVEDVNAGSEQWSSVGMLSAYLQDRQAEIPDTSAIASQVPFNPLAALASQTATSGEIVDIAKEQSLETPPYDIKKDVRGSGVQLVHKGFLDVFQLASETTSSSKAERSLRNVFLPSGWLTWNTISNDFEMEVDVKGIFECRDVI
ncbi:MAG: hypothetical protein [Circular genetic element sp.]|nr:MAG: hypothetical protein [Circular genetic element sp.]